MESLDYFVGVDWGSKAHQLCIVDRVGSICAQRSFEHSGRGLRHMAAWIWDVTECSQQQVGIAIETPRGPVVESLLGAAFKVYSINPKQLDRLRDRFSLAGAKDDRLDAQVLAESVRLDRHLLRE